MTTPKPPPTAVSPPTSPASHSDTVSSKKPGRGRKAGVVAKERPLIPADECQITQLVSKDKADRRRKREERTPQQKSVDVVIYSVFSENVAMGMDRATIADWVDLFVYDWAVSKTHADTAEFMITKACRLYNRKPIWGEKLEIPASESHMITSDGDKMPCH